jgi:signal transduction histidine kinase
VDAAVGSETLERVGSAFPAARLAAAVTWLGATASALALLEQVGHGAGRIAELVQALKTYSYMDQAPAQPVDVHAGLDSTLVMLRSKLRRIDVRREYAPDLPQIPAHGSELNQVWTNILDNAADVLAADDAAVAGADRPSIVVRTRRDGDWVVVELEDNGPGIPDALQARVFDPFFTTKPPGAGVGLGLNISHTIITQRHKGTLTVESGPGRTCFRARLPVGGRLD